MHSRVIPKDLVLRKHHHHHHHNNNNNQNKIKFCSNQHYMYARLRTYVSKTGHKLELKKSRGFPVNMHSLGFLRVSFKRSVLLLTSAGWWAVVNASRQ